MNLLRIEQTYAKIGIETYPSKPEINTRADRLNMNQSFVQVEIHQQFPKVIIDQHECFATAGLKNNMEILEEAAQAAEQQALSYTAQKAQEGDALADIRSRGNPIAEIARQSTFDHHVFDIDLIPKARPRIEVVGGIDISFREGQTNNSVEEGFIDINFTEPKIQMYLLQKPSVQIEYIGNNVDVKI